jgi:hypothetical protein
MSPCTACGREREDLREVAFGSLVCADCLALAESGAPDLFEEAG